MPTYTFPATIYLPPVITPLFRADEIEYSIVPPVAPAAPWQARLRLLTLLPGGLTNVKVAITVARSVLAAPAATAGIAGLANAITGGTCTWNFAAVAVNTVLEFTVDFQPVGGMTLGATFEVTSAELSSSAAQYLTFSTP